MAGTNSFDVVSEFDRQELVNAVDQTAREVHTRYDLKDSKSDLKLEGDKISLTAESEFQLNAIKDILQSKAIKRGLSLKIFDWGKVEPAGGNTVRQTVTLVKGIEETLAKKMVKDIRDAQPKVQAQIQGDAIRVIAKSKDDLQAVITFLKGKDYPVALQFINYR
jgi:cyclic-di-GMP-binding protein